MKRGYRLADPIITSAILEASHADQLANTLAAVNLVLDAELKKVLDELPEEYRSGGCRPVEGGL